MKAAKLPTIRLHDVRHSYATAALAAGVPVKVLSARLGHADISTTQIYTHVLEERLRRLVLDHHPLVGIERPESGGLP